MKISKRIKSNVCKMAYQLAQKHGFSSSKAMKMAWQIVKFAETKSFNARFESRADAYRAAYKSIIAQDRKQQFKNSPLYRGYKAA